MSLRVARMTILFFVFMPALAHAKIFTLTNYHDFGPLSVRSQNPLFLQFIADPLEKASTLKKKEWDISLESGLSNLFERRPRVTGMGIDLDMEIIRSSLVCDYGLSQSYQIGFQIPFLSFSGGLLDTFIQGYHNLFGFPNAGREKTANSRFSYLISRDGNTLYQVDPMAFGIGDLILKQKLNLFGESYNRPAITAKMLVKIPTGDPDRGTGSGYADVALSLSASKSYRRLTSHSQASLQILGGHKYLDSILNNAAAFFAQAFEINLNDYLSFVGQISGSSSIFTHVNISELSSPLLDLSLGFLGEVPLKRGPKKIHYQASFTEDLIPSGPSVDFAVHFLVGVNY